MSKNNTQLSAILLECSYGWFKSLEINKRIEIAANYTHETDDITDIVNGLTDSSEQWLVENFSDDIKDYIVLKYVPQSYQV